MKKVFLFVFGLFCVSSSADDYERCPDRLRRYLDFFVKRDAIHSLSFQETGKKDNIVYQYGVSNSDQRKIRFYYSNDLNEIYIYDSQNPAQGDPYLNEPIDRRESILNQAKEIGTIIQSQSGQHFGEPQIEWHKYGNPGGSYWTIQWTRYSKEGIPYLMDGAFVSFSADGRLFRLTQSCFTREILNKTIKVPENTAVEKTRRFAEDLLIRSYPVKSVDLELKKIEPCILNCFFAMNPTTYRRLSSRQHQGLIVFKHAYFLREKIPVPRSSEGLTYAVSAVYVYIDVETGEMAAFDQLGW